MGRNKVRQCQIQFLLTGKAALAVDPLQQGASLREVLSHRGFACGRVMIAFKLAGRELR